MNITLDRLIERLQAVSAEGLGGVQVVMYGDDFTDEGDFIALDQIDLSVEHDALFGA